MTGGRKRQTIFFFIVIWLFKVLNVFSKLGILLNVFSWRVLLGKGLLVDLAFYHLGFLEGKK